MLTSIMDLWKKSRRCQAPRPVPKITPYISISDEEVDRAIRSVPPHYAASWNFYDNYALYTLNGAVDLDTDTIKVFIASSSYTPAQTTHDYRDDADYYEVSGTGYTAGGKTLTSVLLTLNTSTHLTKFSAANLTWTTVTFTNGRYAILYKSRGGYDTADELIGYVDFGANITMAGVDFSISWNASGIFTCTRT